MPDIDKYSKEALDYRQYRQYDSIFGGMSESTLSYLNHYDKEKYDGYTKIEFGYRTVTLIYKDHFVKYFDNKSGKSISYKQAKACQIEYQAEELYQQGRYDECIEKSKEAIEMCDDSELKERMKQLRDKAKRKIKDEEERKEREKEEKRRKEYEREQERIRKQQQEELERQKQEQERLKKQQEQLERQRQEQERLRKQQEELARQNRLEQEKKQKEIEEKRKLSQLFSQGKTLWNQAWELENNGSHDEAQASFIQSKLLFKQGLDISANEKEFKRWINMISLKIDGNRYFNDAYLLQNEAFKLFKEGERLKQSQKYSEALDMYRKALEKYQKSLEKFENGRQLDDRFNSCIDIVKETTEIVSNEIKTIQESLKTQAFQNITIQNDQNNNQQVPTNTDESVKNAQNTYNLVK